MDSVQTNWKGTTRIIIATSCHHIECEVEVLLKPHDLPILLGHNVIETYGLSLSFAVLKDHLGQSTSEPDNLNFVSSKTADDDARHFQDILKAVSLALDGNASIDQALPCPLKDAIVHIPTMDNSRVYQQEAQFSAD
ncbi:hypothetical protein H4S08_004663 [Coemansia sp. RSA 1365]|nr:hypothetical protein H4S08_004663 [Coemansia sp. RSA 1365]